MKVVMLSAREYIKKWAKKETFVAELREELIFTLFDIFLLVYYYDLIGIKKIHKFNTYERTCRISYGCEARYLNLKKDSK
jgi:hypothetical protein